MTARWVENAAAIVGLLIAAATAGAEGYAVFAAAKSGACALDFHVPWGNVLLVVACVLPKTLGRSTAGKIWGAVGKRFNGGQNGG